MYDNFKVIIIDDASTDKTSEMIQEYIDGLEIAKRNKIMLKKNS